MIIPLVSFKRREGESDFELMTRFVYEVMQVEDRSASSAAPKSFGDWDVRRSEQDHVAAYKQGRFDGMRELYDSLSSMVEVFKES